MILTTTDDKVLGGQVALVTGGGSGIGEAVVRLFATAGAAVVVNDIDSDRAEHLSAELKESGLDVIALPGDVVNHVSCRALMQELLTSHGPVDILVNNAAAMVDLGLLWEMSDHEIDAGMSSLIAALNTLRWLLPSMVERRHGRIVNIGSMAGRVPVPQMPVYSAAKGALHSLTAALAVDLAPYGITINAVAPGVIDTARQRARPPEVLEARVKEVPLGRLGDASDVAAAVLFLCSPDSTYITGETLPIDGGLP